jgi:YVTN family beta-propeller protein
MPRVRLRTIGAATVVMTVLSGCSGNPQQTPPPSAAPRSGSVWVADEGHDSITVIDAATNAVAMTLNGIKGPHNIQVGRDGAVVYAVSSAGVVVTIDPTTYRVSATAPTGAQPAHVIEAPNGKVYVTNSGDGTVSVYQTPGLSPAGLIRLDGMPHGLRPAAGGSVIVVANTMDGAVDLINPATDTYEGAVPVGTSPAQVAVSSDGTYAYTGINDPPSIVKVDLAQRKVVGSAKVPNPPVQLYLTPDETQVVSADQGKKDAQGHTLSVIDTKDMTTRGTVTTGAGPHGVVIDTSGDWAWVTNSYDNTVTAVDLATLTAMTPIPVGTQPSGISYSPKPPATAPADVGTLDIPTPSTSPSQTSQPGDAHAGHH